MINRDILVDYLVNYLNVDQFNDYAPNGLQVEGKSSITKIVTGVSACQALFDKAVALQADAVIVHHGFFWRNENPIITGIKRKRIATLINYDLNLLAYHLPLDCHLTCGNNSLLAQNLGLTITERVSYNKVPNLLCFGTFPTALSAEEITQKITEALDRAPLHIASEASPTRIQRVAWCTGAAHSLLAEAAALKIDAYITGEIAENTVNMARELGIHLWVAGHHATEKAGVQALGEHLSTQFDLEHYFIDIDNPL